MANLSKDIQCAGSDTRPPMLDRTDFASWKQCIRLYYRGKENGVNILKSIDEGPFQMGTFRETLAEGTEGAPHLGPERPRVYSDLSPEDKERMQLNSKFVNNMLPEWGRFVTAVKLNRGMRDSNYDQLIKEGQLDLSREFVGFGERDNGLYTLDFGGGWLGGGGGFNSGGLGGGGVLVVVVDGCVKLIMFFKKLRGFSCMKLLYVRRVGGSGGGTGGSRIGVIVVLIQEMVEMPEDNYKVNMNISCC
ncbi:hypothetical protein Tco_0522195 [Tanacetum coccineum]